MFYSLQDCLLSIGIGYLIPIIGLIVEKTNKKIGITFEICLGLLLIAYTLYKYSFPGALIYLGLIAFSYSSALMLTTNNTSTKKVKEELTQINMEQIKLHKNLKRIIFDISIFFIVVLFAVLFFIFGPDESPLKYFILFGFITLFSEFIKRIIVYRTVTCYFDSQTKNIYIYSFFESRKFSINDCQNVQIESAVDILKLHPLFTLFSSNIDFTTSFEKVLKISLPGETIFLTFVEAEKWKEILHVSKAEIEDEDELVNVLPFYHKHNLKRLFGKLYFATTVKGVSAYSGLLLLLYFLNVPTWGLITVGICYWLLNISISDLVLKTAMDAKLANDPLLISKADAIFTKAGIPNAKLYITDSAQYNGLATGMNIGRAMITLTTATLKLPIETIEGILAHEAIHVKKRDIMWAQIWRACFILFLLLVVIFIKENITNIEAYTVPIFLTIWLLMFLFPIYQSFVSQWMEVRADHLGAKLLEGEQQQMAESLRALSLAQDDESKKALTYQMIEIDKNKEINSLKRESLIWRIIEFQLMPHPPMYWRVHSLNTNQHGWGKAILFRWMRDRCVESISIK